MNLDARLKKLETRDGGANDRIDTIIIEGVAPQAEAARSLHVWKLGQEGSGFTTVTDPDQIKQILNDNP